MVVLVFSCSAAEGSAAGYSHLQDVYEVYSILFAILNERMHEWVNA